MGWGMGWEMWISTGWSKRWDDTFRRDGRERNGLMLLILTCTCIICLIVVVYEAAFSYRRRGIGAEWMRRDRPHGVPTERLLGGWKLMAVTLGAFAFEIMRRRCRCRDLR